MSNRTGGIAGYIAGVSASGGDAWQSSLASAFTNPGWAEFDAIAVSAGGAVLAGGWTQAAEPAKELWDYIPSAFVVRYSPAWPITAPLDYVGPGSATSQSRCTAVAIGAHGMYAVGEQTGAAGDSGRGARQVLSDREGGVDQAARPQSRVARPSSARSPRGTGRRGRRRSA